MRKTILCFIITWLGSIGLFAQQEFPANGLALGFQLNEYQQDFGIGLHLISPAFLKDKVAVKARANLQFHQHLDEEESTWTPYANFSLGLVAGRAMLGPFIQVYGEGGGILLIPSDDFSSESTVFGGYGLFGFSFFLHPKAAYFIELGGVGTGARADQIAGQAIYSNGFLLSVGYRVQL
ncbi:MAG: hypothetical protein AAFP19_08600 [Bacteroidota bacterium]